MIVERVMRSPVLSIAPEASIVDAARLMLARGVSGLPVIRRDGMLVGMVTEGDFLRRTEIGTERKRSWWMDLVESPGKAAQEYVRSHGRKVEEVMTAPVVTASRDAPLEEIVEIMTTRRIKRLPVVGEGKVIGIVTRSDVLRAFLGALSRTPPAPSDDQRIRSAIEAELGRQIWGSGGLIRVSVKDGAVALTGSIFDERERRAARVAAENVAGVRSVSDQLVWIEPISGTVIAPEPENPAKP